MIGQRLDRSALYLSFGRYRCGRRRCRRRRAGLGRRRRRRVFSRCRRRQLHVARAACTMAEAALSLPLRPAAAAASLFS